MSKIHPRLAKANSLETEQDCSYLSTKQETFTIWKKSLVLCGKGFTVFDSNGRIVYRVDNYNCRCLKQVHLLDFKGQLLFTILKKRYKLFRCWEGYKPSSLLSSRGAEIDRNATVGFRVKKSFKLLGTGDSPCTAMLSGLQSNMNRPSQHYKIHDTTSNIASGKSYSSTCKIVDENSGCLIAEVKRKQSACGVVLGEDVLTMVVEPCIDHSLVMSLVIVYNLINSKL